MKTKIETAEKVQKIIGIDFKECLNYKKEIDNFKELSSLQKWLIYDKFSKQDADVVLKKNSNFLKMLGWDGTHLDAIFPVRQILYTLFKTIGQTIGEEDVVELSNEKKEVMEIIDEKNLINKLKDWNEEYRRKWMEKFKDELEKCCRNVHTLGNYMPCPEGEFVGKYNGIKGFQGKWHYNDRIDLLYSDLLDPKCINAKGEYIIDSEMRKEWQEWFDCDENRKKYFLREILKDDTLKILSKFGCLKKATFTTTEELKELKELPNYLEQVNNLIDRRNKDIGAYLCNE